MGYPDIFNNNFLSRTLGLSERVGNNSLVGYNSLVGHNSLAGYNSLVGYNSLAGYNSLVGYPKPTRRWCDRDAHLSLRPIIPFRNYIPLDSIVLRGRFFKQIQILLGNFLTTPTILHQRPESPREV